MTDLPQRLSPEIETLAAKLEGRAQFHARNCKGSYSYFSDTDGDLMVKAAALLRSSGHAQTPAVNMVELRDNALTVCARVAEKHADQGRDGYQIAKAIRRLGTALSDTSTGGNSK